MSRFFNPALEGLSPYTPGEQPQDKKYIKLNTNESPFPPSAFLSDRIREEAENLRLYSDPELRALTAELAKEFDVAENMVFCGNGSDEVLSFAFLAFGANGVAFPDITYGFYPVFAQLYGLKSKIIPLQEDFSVNPQDYIENQELTVLANPNAPTGIALPLTALAEIAQSNPNRVLIVDEAYVDFGAQSAVELLKAHKNILVVQTFSKSRQLAGARLGFALGDAQLIADLNRIKFSFNPYNVNRLTSIAGIVALQDKAWFEECRQKIIATRERITLSLHHIGFEVIESCANFVFAKSPKLSGKDLYLKLKERGILVRHFAQPRIDAYVRITIGTDAQMNALLQAVTEILEEA